MARDRFSMIHICGTKIDLRFPATNGGRGFTRLDRNLKCLINVGTRYLIRLTRDIVGVFGNPRIKRFLARSETSQPLATLLLL
jgi:hypothetical protein